MLPNKKSVTEKKIYMNSGRNLPNPIVLTVLLSVSFNKSPWSKLKFCTLCICPSNPTPSYRSILSLTVVSLFVAVNGLPQWAGPYAAKVAKVNILPSDGRSKKRCYPLMQIYFEREEWSMFRTYKKSGPFFIVP